MPPTDTRQTLYEIDFYSWTQDQAQKLQQIQIGSNEVCMEDIDFSNLIEEIESMGRRERNALGSLVEHVMILLCVAAYTTEQQLGRNKKHWTHEISVFRRKMVKLLIDNPGLKSHLADICLEE